MPNKRKVPSKRRRPGEELPHRSRKHKMFESCRSVSRAVPVAKQKDKRSGKFT